MQGFVCRCVLFVVLATLASAPLASASGLTVGANPLHSLPSPAQGHAYRHGAVPIRGQQMASGILAAGTNNLAYGGGNSGVGVTTGAPQVYLVFWGSQWGTQSTNGAGYTTLSGDTQGMAPYLQAFLKGLGTGSETWSGVMTQYCQGISTGSKTCPSGNTQHVGYPTGGALAGVWVDESTAAPASATANQLAGEAVNAAGHFGNTTSTSNRNTQYVIVSPTGTNPDGWLTGGFCAWHDSTNDGYSVSSSYGVLAFTNLPYIPDEGSSCGENFVNSGTAGKLDGVSIVEGHEYAETITDQFPAGGWTDSAGNENGDKCAWISSGQGASQNITLTTGTFAVQSTWANDYSGGAGGCEVTHPIVTDGNAVTVTSPGNQTSTYAAAIAPLQMSATDSAAGQTFTWSATGLPAGLSVNSSTGVISGTPTAVGSASVTVTATDTTGASGNTTFTWTVGKRSTSTALSCAPSSLSVGVQTTCTATVVDTAAGTAGTPTGSVSFTPSGGCSLAATGTIGTAACQVTYTPTAPGTQTITAAYQGDGTHSTSTSSGAGLSVSTRSTATTLACSPTSLNAGNATTCTATVSDTDAGTPSTPTGTVDFTAAPSGQGSFSGGAHCSLTAGACQVTYTPTAPGTPAITAAYQGDSTHATSGSSGFGLAVGGNLVSVTSPGDRLTTAGTSVSLPVSATDSGGQSLTYTATGLPAGLSIDAATGIISGTPTTPGGESVTVTATDSTGAVGSATFNWTVTPRSTATSLTCAPSTLTAGSASTCSVTVTDTDTGSPSTPTGTVSVPSADSCQLAATATLGVATCQVPYVPTVAGSPTLTASYAGDSAHSSSASAGYALDVTAPFTSQTTAPATSSGSSGSGGGQPASSPQGGQGSAPAGGSSPAAGTGAAGSGQFGGSCPPATGRLSGRRLGLVRLGTTRQQQRAAFPAITLRSGRYLDLFCLTPVGIRAGYPSAALLRTMSPQERQWFAGRVIWATTASRYYSVNGIHAGARLASVRHTLGRSRSVAAGHALWYLLGAKSATILVKVRAGVVQEIGIAAPRLTGARLLAGLVASLS